MSTDEPRSAPGYRLADHVVADTPDQIKAVTDPTRSQILDLVMERAATVTELATALDRPKSSVAYHVKLLEEHGMLQVVRTRRVRAVEERFYGRTGRTIVFGDGRGSELPRVRKSFLASALAEAPLDKDYLATMRHARIAPEDADEFFGRVSELAAEFTRLPRRGDIVMGFVAALYPTDHPSLPPIDVDQADEQNDASHDDV